MSGVAAGHYPGPARHAIPSAMDTTLTTAELRRALEEFRALNPIVSAAAVLVFLAVAEAGEADLRELAEATGMPFTQVCRHADNLSKGDTRKPQDCLKLVRLDAGRVPRVSLTEAGRALHARVFKSAPRPLSAAA